MTLGVLVSGRGSNLEAILGAGLPVSIVISNRPGVRALEIAAAHAVPTRVCRRSGFPDADARDRAIGQALTDAGVELAVLAGYDQLLRTAYFGAFEGRTINIHPSLLPAHGGRGMVGMAVHRSVLAAGEPVTGVTIHEVTPQLDAGAILAQVRVPVARGEDAEGLAARVLEAEHRLLVATLKELLPTVAPSAARHDAC
ncbi:MAG TPA: phosphoribosylglycinamide formyltransferase [Candidatus Limnocylindrales bacterium]|nr:phosphoribosylglycinamide formyltransferase [Candidatus Limnocylindrales bacterium]